MAQADDGRPAGKRGWVGSPAAGLYKVATVTLLTTVPTLPATQYTYSTFYSVHLLYLQDSFAQTQYGWYLTELASELGRSGSIAAPDSSSGTVSNLVLPFSFYGSQLSDFRSLGIGVELYFAQLQQLGGLLLLMGFLSTPALLTNFQGWTASHVEVGSGLFQSDSLTSKLLIGCAMGARSAVTAAEAGQGELTVRACHTAQCDELTTGTQEW